MPMLPCFRTHHSVSLILLCLEHIIYGTGCAYQDVRQSPLQSYITRKATELRSSFWYFVILSSALSHRSMMWSRSEMDSGILSAAYGNHERAG